MIMMLNPYKIASRTTVALVVPLAAPPRLMKKLTVIGMIGHTHGVKIANKPPSNPMAKIHQMD